MGGKKKVCGKNKEHRSQWKISHNCTEVTPVPPFIFHLRSIFPSETVRGKMEKEKKRRKGGGGGGRRRKKKSSVNISRISSQWLRLIEPTGGTSVYPLAFDNAIENNDFLLRGFYDAWCWPSNDSVSWLLFHGKINKPPDERDVPLWSSTIAFIYRKLYVLSFLLIEFYAHSRSCVPDANNSRR